MSGKGIKPGSVCLPVAGPSGLTEGETCVARFNPGFVDQGNQTCLSVFVSKHGA